MKDLAIALAAALAWGPAPAIDVAGNVWTFTPEDMEACKAGGGCHAVTTRAVDSLAREAFRAGMAACKGST